MVTESRYQQAAEQARAEVLRVSSTFCRAKWKQVTMHLHNGMTHSCHHPAPHKVPLAELARSPSALHNTEQKNRARRDLLEGVPTPECSYCWNVENASPGAFSDRFYKSGEWWANDAERPITRDDPQFDTMPAYVEVSFSSVCNFACSYCSPQVSSAWVEDVKRQGPYRLTDYAVHSLDWLKQQGMMPIPEREQNPYVEAFWQWWPTLYPALKVFRITGGEPLLSKHTWRVLDYIDQNPRPDLELAINTNLGVPFHLIERLVTTVNRMIAENKLKSFDIFTSVDTWGEQAAYIRDGMDWGVFLKNVTYVLDTVKWIEWRTKLTIMCTFNLLSIPNFQPLLQFVLDWRAQQHIRDSGWKALWLDIAYLRYPYWQTVQLADAPLLAELQALVEFMRRHQRVSGAQIGFQDVEVEKLERLYAWAAAPMDPQEKHKGLVDFRNFFRAFDQRRGRSFVATFPTLARYYDGP